MHVYAEEKLFCNGSGECWRSFDTLYLSKSVLMNSYGALPALKVLYCLATLCLVYKLGGMDVVYDPWHCAISDGGIQQ